MYPLKKIHTLLLLVLSLMACAQKRDPGIHEPEEINYEIETVAEGIQTPWGIAFLPDGDMLVTERSGKIYRIRDGQKTEIKGVPEVYARGQGGLMDIVLHPLYEKNGWIYLSYSSPEGSEKGAHTAIMRTKIKDNTLTEKQVLYKASPNTETSHHFGSRMVFDSEGFLYFSIGERGARDVNPQDITRDGGKVYRLQDDGTIPDGNPFAGDPEARQAIYSYGHRNPQGMVIHPETGQVWVHEHGPKGGDEINVVKKGANYGWPVITYGVNYSGTSITDLTEKEGMEQPLYYWVPSIAPSGMAFVTSDIYPGWKGNLLAGSLAFQYLERLELDGSKVIYREKLLPGIGRVRDVRQGPDGYIYAAVEGRGIVKLIPGKS
ncbi:PQQ-dependent sugar dehydrogenase [Sinomicrobium soli]|uniref:PQQ-dependent sugar dehydrogenase n=1 Tax=Sinomicrobium sp. N-1-3-6 TaxID=2219864 RepID=UPI000DCE1468|nr:PQQ-dependent sugar dehydrogenase [Sinomicrobium sp. N-1-3-6]RAV30326.1 PQQ-dependent sugar dehydrogenase [Sinomicrobium sp. N-1-3-6]